MSSRTVSILARIGLAYGAIQAVVLTALAATDALPQTFSLVLGTINMALWGILLVLWFLFG